MRNFIEAKRFPQPVVRIAAGAAVVIMIAMLAPRGIRKAQVAAAVFANFEGAQTSPIRLSVDRTRLFAVNTPNGTLSVFDVSQPAAPVLLDEIPVGVEPVSVNPRTRDEAWVVNQVSDSISIVSVSKGIVTDTIYVQDEPSDVVFTGGVAYVSVSRNNQVRMFDVNTHAQTASITLAGGNPRALAVSVDGTKVYAAFAISGNATTLIPPGIAPPQSPPTNTSLPPPPVVGLIVAANDPLWTQYIGFKMPDYDVAVINTGAAPSLAGYYSGVGTINLGIAVNPVDGNIFVSNTDARNLIHFEPNLRGHFVDNRITRIRVATGQVTPFDLNPTINYSILPNPAALSIALAQPTAMVFDPSGTFLWVAAYGTDRVAQVDPNGNVLSRIEISPTAIGPVADPKNKRGPRGLALNAAAGKLYVMNRISNSISIIDTTQKAVISEIPTGFDPTPAAIQAGRGFLYDAKLSGNGTGSCAACHVDGDMDHLAWDLGDPGGNMVTANQGGPTIYFHPMKGPMTTQTLRGLLNLSPYHWRGEKPNFAAFNPAFDGLMGGSQISTADMQTYTTYANSILFQPNPFQNLDRTMPANILGGNPNTGFTDSVNLALTQTGPTMATCNSCHTANPGPGTNRAINPDQASPQPMKNPQLRNMYQKQLRNPFFTYGPNGLMRMAIDGFGMGHDGGVSSMAGFFAGTIFTAYTDIEKTDMAAYMLAFDTGTAPTVGYTRTITPANLADSGVQSDWTLLQNQAVAGNIDLIVRGTINGQVHGLIYRSLFNTYTTETNTSYTQARLQTFIQNGDTLTIMGVYPHSGSASYRN